MRRDLTDKVIVITGASSGIGAATALACGRAGMDVVISARRGGKLEAVADRVRECGRRAVTVVGDVADSGMSARLLDVAAGAFGRFDVVFANAGYGLDSAVDAMGTDELRAIFEVNFFASCDLCNEAVRRWRVEDTACKSRCDIGIAHSADGDRSGTGGQAAGGTQRQETCRHLLMCSSCVSKFPLPFHSAYSATKAAQNHVCRAMRLELAGEGIEVSSVHPITTTTEFWGAIAERDGQAGKTPQLRKRTPKPFVQTPEQVADAIVKCLRKPRPEVWTCHSVRIMAGLFTMFPRLWDRAMRGRLRRKQQGE